MNAVQTYKTILLTGANGDIADAMARIIREHYPDTRLVGADAAGEWPGRALFAEMHRLPYASDAAYLPELVRLAEGQGADLVIPTNEAELRCIAANSATGLPLLCNPSNLLVRFLDKLETSRWLSSIGVPVPSTIALADARADQLPLIVKPRWGSGSRSITVVRGAAHLDALKQAPGSDGMVAQALLEGDDAEFTCALVRPAGRLLTLVMRRRLLGGLSAEIRIERHEAIEEMLARIADHISEFVALNVQLRLTAEGPRIFEINPRFSSTAMMRHRLGFMDLAWACDARLGRPVPEAFGAPVGARVFRRFSEVVVPA